MIKNNSKEKEITMDDLARIMQNGFLSIEGRLDGVEGRLAHIEVDLKDVKADLNKKVDRIEEHNTLKYRVEKLEKKFA